MQELISAVIRGVPIGCVYALVALGFVLTYKTSGVFNLAFGAQAFVSAAVYYVLRIRHGWPIWAAFVIAVVLLGPLLGLLLDRALFRYLRTAPTVAKLVTSLGLLVAVPGIVSLLLNFGNSPAYGPTGIMYHGDVAYHFGSYALQRDQIATIVVTLLAAIGLTAIFRFTAIGLRMRAVVESPRMTELAGVNADRVGAVSWMLSSFFAGLAGVLLAPLFPQLSSENYFLLIVAAIAAAAFASLTSLPMAFLGGLLLGIVNQILTVKLPTDSILAQGLRPSLPFVALFLLLVLWPGLKNRREVTDPLAGVDPPPPGFAADERSVALTRATHVFGALVALGFTWWILTQADSFWLALFTQAVVFSVIFLSITVINGMAGQISLCQATFAAIGALATAQLANNFGMSVLATMVIGAVLAAAVGALLALPALRLGGIFLALATLAFALFFENVMVKFSWVSGGRVPPTVPRPVIGSINFNSDKNFFLLSVVVLAIVSVVVIFVRSGTTGRYLDALRSSEVAASSIGINPARARITAFALSAGIAGLGGGLLAIQEKFANYQADFSVVFGLFWVVLVVSIGARTVEGAIQGGFGLKIFPELILLRLLHVSSTWQFIVFGLGAIAYAKNPEGTLEAGKRKSLNFIQRLLDKRAGRASPDDQPVATLDLPPTEPASAVGSEA
ncbi:MAG: inner-rane translocator [Actinomycetia bacterium]|nr:inner-rane translocator [Actinomycetes bacterium]